MTGADNPLPPRDPQLRTAKVNERNKKIIPLRASTPGVQVRSTADKPISHDAPGQVKILCLPLSPVSDSQTVGAPLLLLPMLSMNLCF